MRNTSTRARGIAEKQQRFAEEFLVDLNATHAAIRAGYSPATAKQQGSRLLSNVDVQAAIQAGRVEQAERTGITADRVIAELAAIAFSDTRDIAEWSSDSLSLIPSSQLTDTAARALREIVSTVSETEHGTTRRLHVKLHDKLAALRLLGQHLGLFTEKVEVQHKGLGDLFEEIRRRAMEPEAPEE